VTASEFAFLALGLVLGVACGAALVEVLRSRPPGRREVRVTVAPNSIPRRASTLAESDTTDPGPARGGPADRRWIDRDMPPSDDPEPDSPGGDPADAAAGIPVHVSDAEPADDRTPVPSGPSQPPFRLTTTAGIAVGGMAVASSRPPVGIAIAREPDPMVTALRATSAASAAASTRSGARRPRPAGASATAGGVATAISPTESGTGDAAAATSGGGNGGNGGNGTNGDGGTDGEAGDDPPSDPMATMNPEDGADAAADAGTAAAADAPDATYAPDDACADQRRIADERCAVATRAREGAAAAQETLRTRQRAYDDMLSSAEAAAAAADPRAVRAAKEAAQLAFREARAVGRTRDDVEAAARDWLTEINRINVTTRDAAATAERHQRAAADLARDLERLSVEADAARISAESAEEACVAAREAVAACQEAVALAAAGASATPETPSVEDLVDAEADLATPMGSRAGEDASIIRMLRGDRDVTNRVVATLAGDDEAERRRWQGLLGGLLEALIARAIEASAFDFPLEGSFWSLFTRSQARDIAGALASLGYRHDGFGGWADDRVPSQRDLSLAVGYAGLDPMRIRRWPSETEMPDLLRDVTVAADEYVWEAAGGLTLGELVTLLGRRADPLAELWNEWGNVRPLLLSAD
jgi:hypothetical protein